MTSFLAATSCSAPLVMLVGLVTAAGCLGLGLALLRLLRLGLPPPFLQVAAIVLGIQANSLAVQALAMARLATPAALIALWGVTSACAVLGFVFYPRAARPPGVPDVPRIALAIAGWGAAFNLVAAVVPSTKIDELYYHMLLPARIVADHGLTPYHLPIESAILPQMMYQIFAAPLHALGVPDAPNVVSWTLSLMLVWLCWTILRQRTVSNPAAYCLVAALLVGIYPIVFDVTGGAHALGDLSLATAAIAIATADSLLLACGPAAFALMVSLLSWSAASSKVSLLPLAGALLVLGGWLAWRGLKAPGSRARLVLSLAAPWLIFGAPLMAWSWLHTGSPFGPLMAGWFGDSFYRPHAFGEYADLARAANRSPLGMVLFDSLCSYSPLIWMAVFGALLGTATPAPVRRWGAALLLLQCALIAWLLPYHARFLGGLHYALVLCFAIYFPPQLARRKAIVAIAIALGIAPWLAGQFVYGQQFVLMAIGLEDSGAFFRSHVAFFDDFAKLDRLLPRNAVLLATDARIPAVYAPRPVVFDPADVAPGQDVFVFASGPVETSDVPADFALDTEVYLDPTARVAVFRRFWVAPVIGELHVLHVVRR